MSLAGHEDTLGASGGHDSSSLGTGMEHLRDHGADLGLHLADTREDLGVEGVGAGELSEGESSQVREDLVVVVDCARDTALLPAGMGQIAVSVIFDLNDKSALFFVFVSTRTDKT